MKPQIGKAPPPGNPMRRFQLPLLGSNQDSPDPEEALVDPELQQLATYARVCGTRCWSLLGLMLHFAVLYSLKCQSLLLPFPQSQSYDRSRSPLFPHGCNFRRPAIALN